MISSMILENYEPSSFSRKPAVKASQENKIHAAPGGNIPPLDRALQAIPRRGGGPLLPAPDRDGKGIDAGAMLIENAKARARAAAAMRGETDPFMNEGLEPGPASSNTGLVANAQNRAKEYARATGLTLEQVQRV